MVPFHRILISFLLAAVAYSAPTIHVRQSSPLTSDIYTIIQDTQALSAEINNFQGGSVLLALPIQTATTKLTQDIQRASANAGYYAYSTDEETQQVISIVYSTLVPSVESTSALLIGKQPLFAQSGLSGQVSSALNALRQASSQYASILVSKDPGFSQAAASIDAALGNAVAYYF